ncbi:MAG: hypothetical protein WCK98_00690 [bacterium]
MFELPHKTPIPIIQNDFNRRSSDEAFKRFLDRSSNSDGLISQNITSYNQLRKTLESKNLILTMKTTYLLDEEYQSQNQIAIARGVDDLVRKEIIKMFPKYNNVNDGQQLLSDISNATLLAYGNKRAGSLAYISYPNNHNPKLVILVKFSYLVNGAKFDYFLLNPKSLPYIQQLQKNLNQPNRTASTIPEQQITNPAWDTSKFEFGNNGLNATIISAKKPI